MLLPSWSLLLFLFSGLAAVFGTEIVDWTDADLASFESRSSADRFYLFYADWCGACKRFKPEFEAALEQVFKNHPQLQVIRVNLDKAPIFSKTLKVSHLPSLFL